MEPLVEVATEEETERSVDASLMTPGPPQCILDIVCRRAVRIGARFIGINNRNLHNFSVDMQTTVRLASRIPRDGSVVFAALSGIRYPALCRMGCALTLITLCLSFIAPLTSCYSTRSDVEPYEQCGASAVLVGETLMRAADPAAAIRSLVGVATTVRDPVAKPLVKVSDWNMELMHLSGLGRWSLLLCSSVCHRSAVFGTQPLPWSRLGQVPASSAWCLRLPRENARSAVVFRSPSASLRNSY